MQPTPSSTKFVTTSSPGEQATNGKGDPKALLDLRHIMRNWWPLATSWVMMTIGGPIIVPMVARLPEPDINLAALGGIVRALTFAIESPLLMILSASTALSKDWEAFRRLRTFTLWGIGIFTGIHAIVTLTPVYDLVTTRLINAPAEIIQPGRWGMMITLPFLAAVVHRRLNQGVLIRFGHSRPIAVGTGLRLVAEVLVLWSGLLIRSIPGVLVGAAAMTIGVTVEAVFIAIRVRPVMQKELKAAPVLEPPPTLSAFLRFYIPLATTSVALLAIQPLLSAALSRMPNPIVSLAVWPPVIGFVFLLGSGGMAMGEVVVALLDQPQALASLRRFTYILASLVGVLTLVVAATSFSAFWFGTFSGLGGAMFAVAMQAFWLALPYPVILVFQGLYQGVLTYARLTQRITEAVVLYFVVALFILVIGVAWGRVAGIYVGTLAMVVGALLQTIWMRQRSIPAIKALGQ